MAKLGTRAGVGRRRAGSYDGRRARARSGRISSRCDGPADSKRLFSRLISHEVSSIAVGVQNHCVNGKFSERGLGHTFKILAGGRLRSFWQFSRFVGEPRRATEDGRPPRVTAIRVGGRCVGEEVHHSTASSCPPRRFSRCGVVMSRH